jgi:hypothetical protein
VDVFLNEPADNFPQNKKLLHVGWVLSKFDLICPGYPLPTLALWSDSPCIHSRYILNDAFQSAQPNTTKEAVIITDEALSVNEQVSIFIKEINEASIIPTDFIE